MEKNNFQFIIDGVVLTPHQLEIINPVLIASFNDRRMSKKALKLACKKALDEAGCPLRTSGTVSGAKETV